MIPSFSHPDVQNCRSSLQKKKDIFSGGILDGNLIFGRFFLSTCSNLVPKALVQQALSHCCLEICFWLFCKCFIFPLVYLFGNNNFPCWIKHGTCCFFSCKTCQDIVVTFLKSVNGIEANGSGHVFISTNNLLC